MGNPIAEGPMGSRVSIRGGRVHCLGQVLARLQGPSQLGYSRGLSSRGWLSGIRVRDLTRVCRCGESLGATIVLFPLPFRFPVGLRPSAGWRRLNRVALSHSLAGKVCSRTASGPRPRGITGAAEFGGYSSQACRCSMRPMMESTISSLIPVVGPRPESGGRSGRPGSAHGPRQARPPAPVSLQVTRLISRHKASLRHTFRI
jgi:hypothetical protein